MAHILLNEEEYHINVPVMRTLELINDSDPDDEKAIKITQNKERELDYKLSVEEHKKEMLAYRRNKEKLCGYLKENCTAMMLTKLESERDYDSKSLNDPIWLLTAIKNKCLVQSGERHHNQLLMDAIKSLGEVKQNDNEKVKDFSNKVVSRTKSFIQALLKAMKETATANIEVMTGQNILSLMKEELVEQLAAYIIQVKADREVYGELQKNLKQQYTLGQKNYKTDVNEAMEVLILNQQNKKKGAKTPEKQKDEEPDARSFARGNREEQQTRFRCFKCGKRSCKGNNQCTHKNKPKSEWA